MTLSILASNLQRLRVRAGRSQASVAQQAGCSAAMLCQIEHGRRWPSTPLLFRLMHALQVTTLDDLVKPARRHVALLLLLVGVC